jgi:lipopolysaccharide transport system ATP-binding protein
MKPAIRVENLCKRYHIGKRPAPGLRNLTETITAGAKGVWQVLTGRVKPDGNDAFMALKDVSFEVQPGEVVGIIGRNGAGKSTLLKVLSRIVQPTSGRLEYRGRMASLLEVGTGFHPELTGRENVYMNGSLLGMKRKEIDKKLDEIVAFSEIQQFIDTPVKRYSSGMYVRLAFAVAAHLTTDILIVDEVLAVGDAAFQQKCMGKMESVARLGRTVLFVSHNMPAVQSLCRLAMLLDKGQVSAIGNTESVIPNYLADASSEERGIIDLRNHPSRPQDQEVILQEVVLSDEKEQTTLFYPDSTMIVRIRAKPRAAIPKARFGVSIEDMYGRRITTFASYFKDGGTYHIDGETVITCRIPRLNLGPGKYLLSMGIATATRHLDCLDNVCWFHVNWRNNYPSGEPYYYTYGPVLNDSEWEVEGGL